MADPKYTKMPEPCGSCRFHAEYGTWNCNYSDIMGVTKHRMHPEAAPGALAGPGCLCYQRGRRRLRPSKVSRKAQKPEKRPAQEAQEARWEAMRIMYLQGGERRADRGGAGMRHRYRAALAAPAMPAAQ